LSSSVNRHTHSRKSFKNSEPSTVYHYSLQRKLKLTDVEIPPTDDAGGVQPTPLGCELVTLDARRSLRRFLPSIISCILATASVAKPHIQQMHSLLLIKRLKDGHV